MPHLRFRAISPDNVAVISKETAEILADLMSCPIEDITYEMIPSQYYVAGECVASYPFIEILWFERGQVVQDQVAQYLTEKIQKLEQIKDVAIVFTALRPQSYYDNGEHYG